jgi:predicted alpha-1,2-mannosidase
MKNFLYSLVSLILLQGSISAKELNLLQYVDPFIGTGAHGHTFPGATAPFGMVQLSPDTRLTGWDGCSGYHYSDSVIYGFSHTHLSGTGCPDYGDILIMPSIGESKLINTEYCSSFNKSSEKAEPAYYSVKLNKFGILAELTSSERCGVHKYTFPQGASKHILIDLTHRDETLNSKIEKINDSTLLGMRRSRAWAMDQQLYFAIRFSKPISSFTIAEQNKINKALNLSMCESKNLKIDCGFGDESKELIIYVALSPLSSANALENLKAECVGKGFDEVKHISQSKWNKELAKIIVEGKNKKDIIKFYTALYHCMIQPNLYSDVNGEYKGRDNSKRQSNFNYYTVFSLWDTYRAYHPLMTIIDQKRTTDFIKTFIAQYEQAGLLPVWELSGNETNCMIGYHAVPVIADAIMKGIRNYDLAKALKAMKNSAEQNTYGLKEYKAKGYVPGDAEHESVSRTLEYAYDDWCIAQASLVLGRISDYEKFNGRAQYYKNIFDKSSGGFMRARFNGGWYSPFSPTEVNNNYTEANSWQYSFYAPQDISGLMELMGGKSAFEKKLDELFNTQAKVSGREQADITGLIGQYAHGNEPSHHIAYLYNYVNRPDKAQKLLRKIMNELYTTEHDGLCGNEDCGQMSAWYVMSALGIYQVCPGDNQYCIGSPIFDRATINLENGNTFTIKTDLNNSKYQYISSATLNGKPYSKSYISHFEIMRGGVLEFDMSDKPSKFGFDEDDAPKSIIKDNPIIIVPTIESAGKTFKDKALIKMNTPQDSAKIYYCINKKEFILDSAQIYNGEFEIKESSTIIAAAILNDKISAKDSAYFIKLAIDKKITLNSTYSKQYEAGGPEGLIDNIRGAKNFRLGGWQGYQGCDFECIVELDKAKNVKEISAGFLQDIRSWIWFPQKVEFYTSIDGKKFDKAGETSSKAKIDDYEVRIEDLGVKVNKKIKFIKIKAAQLGKIPDWHLGAGGDSYIMIDEIIVK